MYLCYNLPKNTKTPFFSLGQLAFSSILFQKYYLPSTITIFLLTIKLFGHLIYLSLNLDLI